MKLIIAVIQDEIINRVLSDLAEKGIRSTKLASTGGFLKAGSTTLLMGLTEEEIKEVVEIIEKHGEVMKKRQKDKDVKVSAGNLFVMDTEEFMKI